MKTTRLLCMLGLLTGACVPKDPPTRVVTDCDGGTVVVTVAPDGGEPAEVPPPGAAPEQGPLETVTEPESPARLPHSPYFIAAGVRIALSAVPLDVVNRGLEHIVSVASNPRISDGWGDAQLLLSAVPLFRPDVPNRPVAYELKLERDGANAGWLIVGAELTDAPIVSFNTRGPTPTERLHELAFSAGATVAKVYQLDGANLLAEDAAGLAVAADPARYFALARNAAGGPATLTPGTAADWPQVKAAFAEAVSDWRAVQTTGFADSWRKEDQVLGTRMSRFATIDQQITLNQASAVGVRDFVTVDDSGHFKTVCSNAWAASPYPVDLDDLTPLWNQINSGFTHPASGSNATCASGCTPLALGIVLGWMDRVGAYGRNPEWTRPDLRRAFFRYASPVSPSQLTSVQDESTYQYSAGAPWTWVGESTTEPGPGTTPAMDMRRYLSELSAAVHTSCDGIEGNTKWWDINGLAPWLEAHQIPVSMHTSSNPFGESGLRDNIIQNLEMYGAPGVMHYGDWAGHTIVVNAHSECDVYENVDGNWQLSSGGNHFFYTNFGWGSKSQNRWLNVGNLMMSTTFTPISAALFRFVHSGDLMTPESSQLGAPAVQMSSSGNPFLVMKSFINLEAVGDGTLYLNGSGGFCLNTGLSTAEGTQAAFYPCANGAYQRFTPWMMSNNHWALYEPFSNKCLGVEDGDASDGAHVVLKKCAVSSDQSQLFTLN